MVKLKKLYVKNYCGYKEATFDFSENNQSKQLAIFFGPNGCGKTSILNAIRMAGEAFRYKDRFMDVAFRKYVFNKDYNPSISEYKFQMIHKGNNESWTLSEDRIKMLSSSELEGMKIEALFDDNGCEKEVIITDRGVIKNELSRRTNSWCYYIDADHPMNMSKFQLNEEYKDKFLELAKVVYNFNGYLKAPVKAMSKRGYEEIFYADFVIDKYGVNVHYKSMSAGEKKIATLLSALCNPNYINDTHIIIVDNVEMHVYFKRHIPMINKILEMFPDKQFFFTTHSGVLVDSLNKRCLYDLEKYLIYSVD